jgi:hypothetical protein
MPAGRVQLIFERQHIHVLALAVLSVGLFAAANLGIVEEGSLWGIGSREWFWLAASIPIAHQLWVWLCWRIELHQSGLSRTLGRYGFRVYAAGFALLGVARVAVVFLLAFANRESLPYQGPALQVLAILALAPAIYLFYSVARYFGFRRALGIDHFDTSYRSIPFVRQGIFRYSSNAMYVFGFMLLWVPGLWYGSAAALVIALFNHLYIWVHYQATELPDIRRIYGDG